MPLDARQLTNAAIQHGEASGDFEYAIGDLEIALHVAMELLEKAGLSDQYESAIRERCDLETLMEHIEPSPG